MDVQGESNEDHEAGKKDAYDQAGEVCVRPPEFPVVEKVPEPLNGASVCDLGGFKHAFTL